MPSKLFFYLDVEFDRVYREYYNCSWEQEETIPSQPGTALLMTLALTQIAVQEQKILNDLPTLPHG